MGFRIEGRDLQTGQPVAPYETRADTEPDARAEAERLGVHILSLTPIDAPTAEVEYASTLADWTLTPLSWNVGRWSLVRLGFEHPRWAKWLYRPLAVSALLLKTKVLFKAFSAASVSVLAAIGLDAHPAVIALVLLPVLLLGPLLVCKPYVFAQLRRLHAPGGLDSRHWLRANDGVLHHFDGRREDTVRPGQVASVHDLPHFVLISTRDAREIAVPKPAFHSATLARRFILTLADAASIEPTLDFRSEWVGQREPVSPFARFLGQLLLFALGAIMLVLLLLLFTR